MTVGRFISRLFKLIMIVLGCGVLVIVLGILSMVYDQSYVQPHKVDRYLAQERQHISIGEGIGSVGKAVNKLGWTYSTGPAWDVHGEVPHETLLSAIPPGEEAYNAIRINFRFLNGKLVSVDGYPGDPLAI